MLDFCSQNCKRIHFCCFKSPNKIICYGSLRILMKESESRSVVSDSLQPHRLYSPCNSPDILQNTGVSSHSLLQGIVTTQRLNPGLLHYRLILSQLSHKGSPEYWSG